MEDWRPLEVKVWGAFACFTRPEMKVERVSYEVMTPSAARGVLEAIFWKPEFAWRVRAIHVLKPIRYISLLRNELGSRQSARGAAAQGGHFFIEDNRQQRHTLALRDVAYVIQADIFLNPHATEPVAKYRDQFRRRVARGQCHHLPYLGAREFAAFFGMPDGDEQPINHSIDLGLMLFDLRYEENPTGGTEFVRRDNGVRRIVRGKAQPVFFHARLEKGVLAVPQALYEEGTSCSGH